jgi:hypothetical protein
MCSRPHTLARASQRIACQGSTAARTALFHARFEKHRRYLRGKS